mgnify:CR=1 FL=1
MGRAGWVAGLATVALAVGTGVAVGQSGGSHPATVPAGSVTLTSCHILLPADGYPRAERSSHRACIGIERIWLEGERSGRSRVERMLRTQYRRRPNL